MSFISENIFGILVAAIVLWICAKLRSKLSYFSIRGMPYVPLKFLDLFSIVSFSAFNDWPEIVYRRSRESDSPYVGFCHILFTPAILIRDPTLAENILIKDFSHFQDHIFDIDYEGNPLSGHLFNMKGDQWRTLRHKLLPTFTSGKLRGMVPLMEIQADNFIKGIEQDSSLKKDTDLKELFKMYSLAVIATCAFGIDPESVKDPNCEFRRVIEDVVKPSWKTRLRLALIFFIPLFLIKLFKIKVFFNDAEDFFFSLTKQSLETRKRSGVKRNDFIQLLLELKEKGSVDLDVKDLEHDEKESIDTFRLSEISTTKLEFTDELLTAQVFVFLIAGFENTAYVSAITMYTLSKHPEVQTRVREEVSQAISKHGSFNYQSLRDMKLLQACIDEALRLYTSSPGLILMRECNKDYTLSDGKVIEKGVPVIISTRSLHLDSKYWTNPEKFEPERFLNGENIQPGTYLPFGIGPRICIAQRLAFIMIKLILAKLVLNYSLQNSPKTKEPLKIKALVGAEIEGGLWGSFENLKPTQ